MKTSTVILILVVMFLLFRKRAVVVQPAQYVTRAEFDELKKQIGFVQSDLKEMITETGLA